MKIKNIAGLESVRLLAAASQVFGYSSTYETLKQEAYARRTTAETREEIDYLFNVHVNGGGDAAMIINIVDNLIDKLENDKFECPVGFMKLEAITSSLTQKAKQYVSLAAVITLQVLAAVFIMYSPFRDLPLAEGFGEQWNQKPT